MGGIANSLQWKGKTGLAVFMRIVVVMLLVIGAAAGSAVILAKAIPHFHVDKPDATLTSTTPHSGE